MADKDPEHWLFRLSAEEWLRAAQNELARAEEALAKKNLRGGVVQARRAAGMAWNAVLIHLSSSSENLEAQYGRSYMEHLQALTHDASVPESVQSAAQALVGAKLATEIVQLGRGDTALARAAELILEHARKRAMPETV